MTAELWLLNPCSTHGAEDCWNTRPEALCRGPLWKRLDPDTVVTIRDAHFERGEWGLPVADIINALTEQETDQ